ncbi:MAG: LCP family protein [Defluviitaleaceae bacterium]|nr:LCP family protein [Defluviitaleaceae bacterium]
MLRKILFICIVIVGVLLVVVFGAIGGGLAGFFNSSLPQRTNVLLLGSDAEVGIARADAIMIVSVHGGTGAIDLVSVPRDTYVVMPAERLAILRENGRNTAAASGVMRLNEVTHHAGPVFGPTFAALQVEELLGIDIHYYVHINLSAFRYIVDQIGGIEFNVPQRMFYSDPYQDLLIDLQPGLQHLDGAAAEGLVRYRSGYADGDLGRARTQQQFMMAAFGQILARDNIMANPLTYLNVFINYVDTNMGVLDMPRYLGLLGRLDIGAINTHTLMGTGTRIGGRFFYIVDEGDITRLRDEVFYALYEVERDENSFGLDIEILNGTDIEGLAARTRQMLTDEGYTVVGIGNYGGQREAHTRIMVRQAGTGQDLTSFFAGSRVVVDETIGADILIILGTDYGIQ